MAFKEVNSLDTDNTISLGGSSKKTGKANPTSVEGYYLGSKDIKSDFSKTGLAKMHVLQTRDGNVGVYGKTDLDRKIVNAPVGSMVRLSFTGTQPIKGKADMYKFKVEVDAENTIEVDLPSNDSAPTISDEEPAYADDIEDAEDEVQEAPPTRAAAPRSPAKAPDPARASAVQALLNRKRA